MLLATSLVIARIFKTIFFGQLRDVEVESLIERAKFTITETCLALTIFRNELSPLIISMFGLLIFIKLLHKLSKQRLQYLEQIMVVTLFTQIRYCFLLLFLISMDAAGTYLSSNYVLNHGKSVVILFGFEFGLQLVYAFNLAIRFFLQMLDSYLTNGLSSRGFYSMLTDLICEAIKFITYSVFFGLIFFHYGFPIHLMRDVWAAYSSLHRKFVSFLKYIRLSRNLQNRFPDATAEELGAAGNCLVCREDMNSGKKLPCGHIFHLDCLRLWLQHQQACPLCRFELYTVSLF
jgi:E3 ubiquitin-protein ligase synoviolin